MYFRFCGWRRVCAQWPRIGDAKQAYTQSESGSPKRSIKPWVKSDVYSGLHRLVIFVNIIMCRVCFGLVFVSLSVTRQIVLKRLNGSRLRSTTSLPLLHCSQKYSTKPPTIVLIVVVQFQKFLVQILLSKYAIERWFNFPPPCLVYVPYVGKL